MILKVYLTEAQFERYKKCAEAEHRSLSNYAEYSMNRRSTTNPPERAKKAKNDTRAKNIMVAEKIENRGGVRANTEGISRMAGGG